MKVLFSVRLPIVGCEHEETIELPEGLSDEQIQAIFEDWLWEQIGGFWEVVE